MITTTRNQSACFGVSIARSPIACPIYSRMKMLKREGQARIDEYFNVATIIDTVLLIGGFFLLK